ncbi:alpha/beta-hydrolase [Hypoxylon sp. FL1150]|nr:alpha/beta-hydrolase [Hypoxylon sp. FL1150]
MADEKSSTSPPLEEEQVNLPQAASRKSSWSWVRVAFVFLAIAAGGRIVRLFIHDRVQYGRHHAEPESQAPLGYLDGWTEWSDITPSEKLAWQPCFGVYGDDVLCARLTVPMDYHRPLNQSANNPKVHLALVMRPGSGRTKDPSSYSDSPLLINPGGPGGSGALLAIASGQVLRTAIGTDRDIVGFDPRGVGATTPKADCFAAADDPFGLEGRNVALMNRVAWVTSGHDVGIVNSSNVALGKLSARSKALARLCKRVDEADGDDSIFRYSNTPNVARDMLSIVHAWDEWRSDSSDRPAAAAEFAQESETEDEPQKVLKMETNDDDSTKGKLVYWGFSYGTLLGATFASMFPDKVGRLILDGVVDADHYVNPVAIDNILDTDAIWEKFFDYCVDAGPKCAFFLLGDTPETIKKRFDETFGFLEKEPAVVLPRYANVPVMVTASDIKLIIFSALYAPISGFPLVAQILKALVEGNLDFFVAAPMSTAFCHNLTLPVWPDDAQKVIGCGDKRYKLNDDVDTLQKRFEEMASYSDFADIFHNKFQWMTVGFNLPCNGWDIDVKDPPMRWDDNPAHKPAPINTSFPILFLSNNLDPVTPLHSALKMTRKFSTASIVEQKAMGHCTLSCVSLCTINHIRAYLDKGILPPSPEFDSGDADTGKWATCECDEKPWHSLRGTGVRSDADGHSYVEMEDEEILQGKTDEEAEAMLAYKNLRAQIIRADTVLQHFDYRNPLAEALVHTEMLLTPLRLAFDRVKKAEASKRT